MPYKRAGRASMTLVLDEDLHARLGAHATAAGRSMTSIITQAVTEHLDSADRPRHQADRVFAKLRAALPDWPAGDQEMLA